jgi:outer membrane lipoprotein carrier protein
MGARAQTSIFLALFLFSLGFGQQVRAEDDLAAAVEARYSKVQSWSAEFVQTTHIEVLNQDLEKNATIQVARPKSIRIEYLTDPKKIYVSDGSKLWIYKNDDTSALQFDDPQAVLSREALSFLGGFQNLSEIFDIVPNLKEAEGFLQVQDKTLKKVALIPKDDTSDIIKITLGVDDKTMTVKEAVLFNASGNVTHYTFNKIQFDQKIDPVVFSLPKEPKRKIIKK